MLMDRSSNKDSIFESIIILGEKNSLNDLSEKNNPSNTSYSNYLDTNVSTTFSTPNRTRWDNTSGQRYYSNQMISNNASCNNSFK